ncbi:MAG TPA: WYL domain-containing protein [Clostridiales bacterium]|nr:WYL domain-containing protein [Clostridiales bacterium]
MESLEPKKLALIRILNILEKHSDEEHPLKHEEIVALLDKEYGLIIERKAVGRNISLLNEAGYDIETTKRGSYLAERKFEESELKLLIDGVLSSRYITPKQSKDVIEKLCGEANRYFKKRVKHVYSVNDWDKTENVAVFYNIEIADEAIEKGKKITFDYNKYGADKKMHRSATHTVSPYQMILHNQRYYLMGFNEKWRHIQYYRMDRITDIRLSEENGTPLKSIEGFESGIDYKRFSRSMPYMFFDEPQPIEFIADGWAIDQIIDWLGKDLRIEERADGRFLIRTKASVNAMEYWAMQYLNAVEIVSPKELRERIKKNLQTANEKYKE